VPVPAARHATKAADPALELPLDYNAARTTAAARCARASPPTPGASPSPRAAAATPSTSRPQHPDSVTGEACGRSFVTRRPDFHFTFAAGTSFPLLRFYVVTGNGADATLLINEPNTQWRCNDDHHHEGWGNPLMPVIDFHNPAGGPLRHLGGHLRRFERTTPRQLFVTELDSNHP
jgi:hypothetical protein